MDVGVGEDLEDDLVHRDAEKVADEAEKLLMELVEVVGVIKDHGGEDVGESVNTCDKEAEGHICLEELVVGRDQDEKVEEAEDDTNYSEENVYTIVLDLFSHTGRD
jgi:hypothetical protein